MISRGPHGLHGGPRDARRSRGAVAVEFALVVQLFMAMTFGMVDMSRLMFARWMVSYAVERGGRAAAVHPAGTLATLSAVQGVVASSAALIGLVSTNVTVKVNGTTVTSSTFATRQSGDAIIVTTTYTFRRLLPFVLPAATYSIVGSTQTEME